MKKRQHVDLDRLRPVSVAEVARRPNQAWNPTAEAPDLFEYWWLREGRKLTAHLSRKAVARAGWSACAESLGVYDDQDQETRCADCAEAARLAYSDATTPGFFSPKCEHHQEQEAKQS